MRRESGFSADPADYAPSSASVSEVNARPLRREEREGGNFAQKAAPVHKAADQVQTAPLSPSEPELTPLPIGELLDNRRYVVLSLIEQGANQNLYMVKDRVLRCCSECGANESQVNDSACQACEADFAKQPLRQPEYLLRETLDQKIFETPKIIATSNLQHPGMVNLYRAFDYSPYGSQARFYLLADPNEGIALSSLPRPQPEEKVLNWGKQLAEVLAYLHSNRVGHGEIRLENVFLVGKQVKLANFHSAQKWHDYAPKTWQADEMDALGDILFKLLNPLSLSAATTAIFERFGHSDDRFFSAQAFADALDEAIQSLQKPGRMTHLVGSRSDIGQMRRLNEDHLLTLKFEDVDQSEHKPMGLYLVADGMGGHETGEVASTLAARTMAHRIASQVMFTPFPETPIAENRSEQALPDYAALLKEACQSANQVIYEQSQKNNSDMGTTLVAALVVGHIAYIANVGDSRAYLVNQGAIKQLTNDHSFVGRLLTLGQISREQARTHPQRHVVYRTLGDKPQVEVDIFEQKLRSGDTLLLCSDGLPDMISEAQIHHKVMKTHPQDACDELVRLANQAGGEDNIAVIVVKVEQVGKD
ncbi:MAG: Stp1/IreP family PP2C-type Ser/Thr phosphatase [Ardenticatenaceae bacterium]